MSYKVCVRERQTGAHTERICVQEGHKHTIQGNI